MAKKVAKKAVGGASYDAKSISVLEGLEPVRKRPGMYIGSTGVEGMHHLIWEVFDNGRDEAMGGFADRVEVALLPGNRVRVVDNGRGIPVDMHKKTKVSALETIMTTLHAGGKFDNEAYKFSGGLHGVGVSVVNALSTHTKAEVHKEDKGYYVQEYERGKQKAKVKKLGSTDFNGTIITFEPDPEIFNEIEFHWKEIVSHLRQQAYLVKGLEVNVLDAREIPESELSLDGADFLSRTGLNCLSASFYFDGGLRSLVKFYNEHQKPVHKNIFHTEQEVDNVQVEIALQYVDDISSREVAFANNTFNSEGGMHMTGFKTALTRTINDYARKNNLLKEKDDNFTGDDVREGITAVISVKLQEIQFEGQTKAKLGSVEARGAVDKAFTESFGYFLEEHPDDAKAIIGKASLALRARKAAKAAKDSVLRKGALEGMTLPGKLADCQTKSAERSEIFIVEGDSAGGSSKQGRDRETQAILPLRGKILNVERARLDRMLSSDAIKSLVIALGTGIGENFDVSNLRYHKIILATDADVDGAHIRTLLLTLFYRYFPELVEGGYIYIAKPPLYKIQFGKKDIHYVFTEEEKVALVGTEEPDEDEGEPEEEEETQNDDENEAEESDSGKKKGKGKPQIQRYKGLGEMNPDELWETTMNPATRVLKRVTIEDVRDADMVFDTLMGKDVAARKSFIQSNAKLATIDM